MSHEKSSFFQYRPPPIREIRRRPLHAWVEATLTLILAAWLLWAVAVLAGAL